MLAINTVAAGGGSICRFDGTKLTVGPESAGADPGPACYGRGGPLTVSDLNYFHGDSVGCEAGGGAFGGGGAIARTGGGAWGAGLRPSTLARSPANLTSSRCSIILTPGSSALMASARQMSRGTHFEECHVLSRK